MRGFLSLWLRPVDITRPGIHAALRDEAAEDARGTKFEFLGDRYRVSDLGAAAGRRG
jgi:hypothetical protein